MNDENHGWQRLGGYLVLLLVAILFVLGSRSGSLRGLFRPDAPAGDPTTAVDLEAEETTTLAVPAPAGVDDSGYSLSELPILTDSSLVPNPVAITYKPALPQHSFITYTVQAGDTAIGIAQQFGIKEETLLGGNAFLSSDAGMLQAGAVLTILPIDGVLHDVVEGDTLEGLAAAFDIPVEDIIAYAPNNLEFPYRLQPDSQIVLPGAVREAFFWEPPVVIRSSNGSGSSEALQGLYVANLGTGSFIWPVSGRNISQYYWYGHPGLDIALVEGSGVYAADSGTVTYAAWSPYCYGNLIVINHGNGYETFYAHLSGINVYPGQVVNKGNLIGASGNTGCSSGPHLHFEIRYNRNRYDPLSYLP